MKVFEPKYVQRIENKYGQLPDYEKPEIYFIVASDQYQDLRDEIETMVAILSQDKQKKVIPRLQSKENFIPTYNELIVGSLLRKLGYRVEYDKKIQELTPDLYDEKIQELTPDWYVYPKEKTPAFLFEVFTTDSGGEKRSKEDWQVQDLEGRFGKIAIDATLRIRLDEPKADSRWNKRITQEIKQWLTQQAPPVGTHHSGEGFTCKIVKRNTGLPKVKLIVARHFFLVDTEPLLNTIKEKIKKYETLKMPLVVAVVTDSTLGEELRNILMGGREEKLYYNTSTDVEESTTFLLNDGLFKKAPDLSAVVWVSHVWSGGRMTAIYNPTATKPLPANTFNEDRCPLYELSS